ncbi:MAG: AAA family ATPase [Spirochaetaceae bacterium]|nr:MAG: AAA family ATPase [Spirochaetaceae bacterium]
MSAPASLPMTLRALRLSGVLHEYEPLAQQATRDEWSYEQYLAAVLESELCTRTERRTERILKRSNLPESKSLATLDMSLLPTHVRRQIPALVEGGFVDRAENVLAFGLPGRGKTHLLAAIARELILQRGTKVLFTTCFHLVQQLLMAKRDLAIEPLLKKLDRFEVVVLDDIGYVQQSREEMEVLFTFLSERYERRSMMITSNLLFSDWDKIFKDPMTTAAAIDRVVHHATILELNGESYRAKSAGERNRKS